jgi:hemerythrin-like domain-containing protein
MPPGSGVNEEGSAMAETSPLVESLLKIHKIITRALNVSIQKCDEYLGKSGVPAAEAGGFLMYVTTLKRVLHSHHLTEDELAFPYFRAKLEAPFDRLGEDHRTVARLLVTLEECLPRLSSGGLGKLREVLGELEGEWAPHIKIEEENVTAEKLNRVADVPEQLRLIKQFEEHGRKNAGPGPLALPFFFYNLEGADREAFLVPFPWMVKKVLVPFVWRAQWKPMRPFLLV